METKHTKGKWVKRQGDSDYKFDILGEFGTNKTIALIPNKCFVSDEEAEANAKLIASAPKLLETLKYVVDKIENMDAETWWLTCPTKGGFDMELIEDAIKGATE